MLMTKLKKKMYTGYCLPVEIFLLYSLFPFHSVNFTIPKLHQNKNQNSEIIINNCTDFENSETFTLEANTINSRSIFKSCYFTLVSCFLQNLNI